MFQSLGDIALIGQVPLSFKMGHGSLQEVVACGTESAALKLRVNNSLMYWGACPLKAIKISTKILKSNKYFTGSQHIEDKTRAMCALLLIHV